MNFQLVINQNKQIYYHGFLSENFQYKNVQIILKNELSITDFIL